MREKIIGKLVLDLTGNKFSGFGWVDFTESQFRQSVTQEPLPQTVQTTCHASASVPPRPLQDREREE